MLGPCFVAVSLFTIAMCCVCSWRRSRPWLAVGGVVSAAMAIASAIGLLLLLGYGMTSVAYSMPFIVFCTTFCHFFFCLQYFFVFLVLDECIYGWALLYILAEISEQRHFQLPLQP
ncbi:hypothetical protein COOONC_12746 [Cooperia oncophora]